MGTERPRAVVLDSGALIAFERNDKRLRALIELAMTHRGELVVPAGVVAQVWRDGRRQSRLARLLASGLLRVQALDLAEAQAAGVLCGRAGTSDVVDASVALVARRYQARVVTSDPDDLQRIDPSLELARC